MYVQHSNGKIIQPWRRTLKLENELEFNHGGGPLQLETELELVMNYGGDIQNQQN